MLAAAVGARREREPGGRAGGAGSGFSPRTSFPPPVSRDADLLLWGEGGRASAAAVLTASPRAGTERPRCRPRHGAAPREARRRKPVPAGGGRQRPPRRPGAPCRPHLQREAEGAAPLLRYRRAGLLLLAGAGSPPTAPYARVGSPFARA